MFFFIEAINRDLGGCISVICSCKTIDGLIAILLFFSKMKIKQEQARMSRFHHHYCRGTRWTDDVRTSLLDPSLQTKSKKPEISCALHFHPIRQTTKGGCLIKQTVEV